MITGGATGIGFALAEKFVAEGSTTIICGRRMNKLRLAKHNLPELSTIKCDVSVEAERRRLLNWTKKRFPDLNVLVNNAGIQREVDFASPTIARHQSPKDDEIAINLQSAIRLCALSVPGLLKRRYAVILNISSGLAFAPIAMMPIYCATKAAMHSFTVSLRHQLRNTSIRVFEAAPPTTDTELDRSFAGPEEQAYRGISPREVAQKIVEGLREGKEEIIIGEAQRLYNDPKGMFARMNQ